jgi:CubicO group peptidase (beta-lactamase class C family)
MRRLLPTAQVWRGEGDFVELEHAPRDLDGIAFNSSTGLEKTVADMIEESSTDGFLVLHEGRIVTERYFNNMGPEQPHLLQSVTKSFAGSVTGILVKRGELDPQARVTEIVPELAGSAYENASVRQLLDMTVGIDFDEDYDDPSSGNGTLSVAIGWEPRTDSAAPDNLRDYLIGLSAAGEHGAKFHYVSVNTEVLSWVLERTSGLHFAELVSREIWQPMGAEFDAYITLDRLGAPVACGGLCVTLRDLARFGQLHLQDGVMNGRQIVPRSWVEDTRQSGDHEAWAKGDADENMANGNYRNQWWITGNDHGAYCGLGIYGQSVYVDPRARMVIAKLSTEPQPEDQKHSSDRIRAFEAIGRALA